MILIKRGVVIALTKGFSTIIDYDDLYKIKPYKWFYSNRYARAYTGGGRASPKIIAMHRLILNMPDDCGFEVDHIDGNGLNNQRNNLRICTRAENNRNCRKLSVSSSRYKGVTFDKQTGKWRTEITFNYKRIRLGRFSNEEEAARVYDKAALKYHGAFAKINFEIVS